MVPRKRACVRISGDGNRIRPPAFRAFLWKLRLSVAAHTFRRDSFSLAKEMKRPGEREGRELHMHDAWGTAEVRDCWPLSWSGPLDTPARLPDLCQRREWEPVSMLPGIYGMFRPQPTGPLYHLVERHWTRCRTMRSQWGSPASSTPLFPLG
jgi:hypothetical protein